MAQTVKKESQLIFIIRIEYLPREYDEKKQIQNFAAN